jgi:Regulator of chromosome condensation (RCC1) repeat
MVKCFFFQDFAIIFRHVFSLVFNDHLSQNTVRIHTSAFYYVVQYDKKCSIIYLNPEIDEKDYLTNEVKFQDTIKEIQLNNEFFLVLTDGGELHKYDARERSLKPVKFLNVEDPGTSEVVTQIAVGDTMNVAVTNKNNVYTIPNKIFELSKHEKVKKVCCGAEHALLLTANGDVYSWGIGL